MAIDVFQLHALGFALIVSTEVDDHTELIGEPMYLDPPPPQGITLVGLDDVTATVIFTTTGKLDSDHIV